MIVGAASILVPGVLFLATLIRSSLEFGEALVAVPIRGALDFPQLRDGVLALQRHHDDGHRVEALDQREDRASVPGLMIENARSMLISGSAPSPRFPRATSTP
jgi:hypothetical protein